MPISIGQKFEVEVQMNSVISAEDASYYRIRAYAYKGDDIFENFDCGAQPAFYAAPKTFECELANGPPDTVRPGGSGSTLVWENMCVIVDELAMQADAGDMYAVCFCDGHLQGCESPYLFQTLVQVWELSGGQSLRAQLAGY